MASFLSLLADKILQDDKTALSDVAVILPNKRTQKMLQKELAEKIGKPFFSPGIFSINDFIETLSSRKKISTTSLLIRLYSVYSDFEQIKEKEFNSFLSWGSVFLQDINDIDMHLADASQIFQNLGEIKEMETSFGRETLTQNQQHYITFYTTLRELYLRFAKNMEEDLSGYEGAIYRDVALNIEKYAAKLPYKRYIFAGLSMLSPAEYQIINYYITNHQAELLFDFDEFYISSLASVTEKIKQNFHLREIQSISRNYATVPKVITQTGLPKKLPQILYAIDRLKEIEKEQGNLDNTALVLADESLLVPFVHAYDCTKANMTMGYPIAETPVFNLLQNLIDTARNSFRFQNIQQTTTPILYHKDLLVLFRNPVVKEAFFTDESHAAFIEQIISSNKIFFKYDDIPDISKDILPDLNSTGLAFLKNLADYFHNLEQHISTNDQFSKAIGLVYRILLEEEENLKKFHFEKELDHTAISSFIKERFKAVSIPLKGDPDKGLQVMGLLETRGLDFKNVIILSVNEGVLPAGKSQSSLILYDVKRFFHLPGYQENETVFAYHFFRLLQRAEQVYLVYDNDSSDSLAEKSRFISQLEFEIKAQQLTNNIEFKTDIVTLLPDISQEQEKKRQEEFVIPKTERIMEILKRKHYSPTSLSTYITCPFKFYLSAIERIEPAKTVNENIEQNVIGSIIHEILEDIFDKIKEHPDKQNEIIEKELLTIEETVAVYFEKQEEVKGKDQEKGRLFLATEVVKRGIISYLQYVKTEYLPASYEIIGLEEELSTTVQVNGMPITLIGKGDRIDLQHGKIHVLDYKTGKVEQKDLEFENISDVIEDPKKSKIFQLFMYACVFKRDKNFAAIAEKYDITCAIVSFREANKSATQPVIFPRLKEGQKRSEIMQCHFEEFEEELIGLLAKILDTAEPFRQTAELEYCRYCDYKTVCGR